MCCKRKTILDGEQLQDLLEKLIEKKQYDKACMLSLAMNNGRRKSELPRMKLSYFTEDNVIYGSLYKTPETVTTKGRGSRGKQLTVYTLRNGFQKYLDLWLKYREENNITSEWLIPRKENGVYIDEQIPITTMDSWADTFTRMLGVPFYWHSLRHYFTTACSVVDYQTMLLKTLLAGNQTTWLPFIKTSLLMSSLLNILEKMVLRKSKRNHYLICSVHGTPILKNFLMINIFIYIII